MRWLQQHGFIDVKPGPFGELSYAVIFNPYHVIRRHYEAKHPAVTEARYNALMARADEIGADDFADDLPDDWKTRKPRKKKAGNKAEDEFAKPAPTRLSVGSPRNSGNVGAVKRRRGK